ncbi:hypothetical protein VCHA40O237_60005 [Vibrio chagasii]|nr:hypothetical protein [Vibrio chagasii]MCG9568718.1 hypothetical protein [Vibrio chagasii]CAH7067176.1 hypothetical protein VCHA34P115_80005 [Vibrio chagasii]CAH7075359.1 hypothetical protein VCHA34P120_70241 [Vibrio chagasii]CAH7079744.1 hypothetical protein VCHA36O157_80203 [Vibrio chagasii]CAH7090664.1 hypothetical protein VCHA38P217_100005 [Vibrio chagasii]
MSGNLASNSEIEIMLVGMLFWGKGGLIEENSVTKDSQRKDLKSELG